MSCGRLSINCRHFELAFWIILYAFNGYLPKFSVLRPLAAKLYVNNVKQLRRFFFSQQKNDLTI